MRLTLPLALLTASLLATPCLAQTFPTKFAVVSIKPDPNFTGWNQRPTVGGFTARGITLRNLITQAYGIPPERLSGGPVWIDSDKFAINATIGDIDPAIAQSLSLGQRLKMLQALLEDRFKIVLRHEPREFSVFALVVAKNGPKLKSSPPEKTEGVQGFAHVVMLPGNLSIEGATMSSFSSFLSGAYANKLERPVIDRTGLSGRYDITVTWDEAPPPTQIGAPSPDTGGPALIKAIEQQLGLNLQPVKAPLDTIVVVSADHPTQN